MGTLHNLAKAYPQATQDRLETSARKAVFLRALMRFQGHDEAIAITIREISATGMKASTASSPFPGGKVEIGLRNLGAVPATIMWAASGMMEVAFDRIIDPEAIQMEITGTYTPAPDTTKDLRRI
jgi:hypothetical protein